MATGSGGVEESRQLLKQLSHQSSSERYQISPKNYFKNVSDCLNKNNIHNLFSFVGEELDLLTNVYFDDLQITHTER